MGRTREKATRYYIDRLARIGQEIVNKELSSKSYTNRSYNLHDSYGWCVYVNGKIAQMGFAGAALATKNKEWYGREIQGRSEITKLFESSYAPSAPIELAIGVAMPYGGILHQKGYEVFAVAALNVQQAAMRIKGARYKAVGWI